MFQRYLVGTTSRADITDFVVGMEPKVHSFVGKGTVQDVACQVKYVPASEVGQVVGPPGNFTSWPALWRDLHCMGQGGGRG